jgi:hypothetical protein
MLATRAKRGRWSESVTAEDMDKPCLVADINFTEWTTGNVCFMRSSPASWKTKTRPMLSGGNRSGFGHSSAHRPLSRFDFAVRLLAPEVLYVFCEKTLGHAACLKLSLKEGAVQCFTPTGGTSSAVTIPLVHEATSAVQDRFGCSGHFARRIGRQVGV